MAQENRCWAYDLLEKESVSSSSSSSSSFECWFALSIVSERSAAEARLERAKKRGGQSGQKKVLREDFDFDEACEELLHEYLIQWIPPRSEFDNYPSQRSAQLWWTRQDVFQELVQPGASDDWWFEFYEAHKDILGVKKGSNNTLEAAIPAPEADWDEFENGIPWKRALALVSTFSQREQLAPSPSPSQKQAYNKEPATEGQQAAAEHQDEAAASLARAVSEYQQQQQPKVPLEQVELIKLQGMEWLAERRLFYGRTALSVIREAISRFTEGKETGAGRRRNEAAEYVIYLESRHLFMLKRKKQAQKAESARCMAMCPRVGVAELTKACCDRGFQAFDQDRVITLGQKEVNFYRIQEKADDNSKSLLLERQILLSNNCTLVQARRTEFGDYLFSVAVEKRVTVIRAINVETNASSLLAFLFDDDTSPNLRRGFWGRGDYHIRAMCALDNGLAFYMDTGYIVELSLDMDALDQSKGFDAKASDCVDDLNDTVPERTAVGGKFRIPVGSCAITHNVVEGFNGGRGITLVSAPEGNFYAGANEHAPVFLRELGGPTQSCPVLTYHDFTPNTCCLCFSPDGRYLAVGRGATSVWLFEMSNFEAGPLVRYELSGVRAGARISSLAIADDRLVAASDGFVSIFSTDSPDLLYRLTLTKDQIRFTQGKYTQDVQVSLLSRVFLDGQDALLTFGPDRVGIWVPEERMTKGARKR